MVFDEGKALSTQQQQYEATSTMINELRRHVDQWRSYQNSNDWHCTPETTRLLQHWRNFKFNNTRPFLLPGRSLLITVIWLTEVAPQAGKTGKGFLDPSGQRQP